MDGLIVPNGDAFEIKWQDATTDGDHITKEHTRLIGGDYYFGDTAWEYIRKYTGVDLLAVLNRIASEKTDGK